MSQQGRDYRALFSKRSRIATPVPNWEQLRILPAVLDMIIGFVLGANDGLGDLKNLLLTTKWFKASALKDSVIQKLNVTAHRDYAFWCHKSSHFNPLFLRLLRARHTEAVYIDAMRLAFNRSELETCIILIETIPETNRRAKIMFFVMNRFIRNRVKEVEFCSTFSIDGMDMWRLGGIIERNIGCFHLRAFNTFGSTFTYTGYYEDCGYDHPRDEWEFMRDADICPVCVLHWLAKDLVKLFRLGEYIHVCV